MQRVDLVEQRKKADHYRRTIAEHAAQRGDFKLCECDLCNRGYRLIGKQARGAQRPNA